MVVRFMGKLAVRRVSPRWELRECIKDIWVFESGGGLSEEEMQTIIPNGSAKLMLYYEGQFTGRVGDRAFLIPEHKLFVLGVADRPTIAEFDRNRAFGCICAELHPAFAYRLLTVPQHELRNMLVPFGELDNRTISRTMEAKMQMTSDPVQKAALLQEYLIEVLARSEKDAEIRVRRFRDLERARTLVDRGAFAGVGTKRSVAARQIFGTARHRAKNPRFHRPFPVVHAGAAARQTRFFGRQAVLRLLL